MTKKKTINQPGFCVHDGNCYWPWDSVSYYLIEKWRYNVD